MTITKLQATVGTSPLGQKTSYPKSYDKGLLFPILRDRQRQAMEFPSDLTFVGFDVWNAYELYWLNLKGKPLRSMATFLIPADSPNLIEAKSVKLYLHSLNNEKFATALEVAELIKNDLSKVCGKHIQVIMAPQILSDIVRDESLKYQCLDNLDIAINHYHPNLDLLGADPFTIVERRLYTHAFKSHCLCTGQPDMGSIFIDYTGPKIDEKGLLAYLISYRDHGGFSENCIEQIFVDVCRKALPKRLSVFGRFTRRGGIDINPYRSTHEMAVDNFRVKFQ